MKAIKFALTIVLGLALIAPPIATAEPPKTGGSSWLKMPKLPTPSMPKLPKPSMPKMPTPSMPKMPTPSMPKLPKPSMPKMPSMPTMPWSAKSKTPAKKKSPGLMSQLNKSTQKGWNQTKKMFDPSWMMPEKKVSPSPASASKLRTREESIFSGMFGEKKPEKKISTVNDFLGQPRPGG